MHDTCLTSEDVHEMLAALDAAPADHEARQSKRIQLCAPMTVVSVHGKKYGDAIAVLVHDLSPQGVGFVHTESIPLGTRYMIPSHSRTHCTMILFNVVFCAPMDDGQFRIGARFLNVEHDGEELDPDLEHDPLYKAIFG